MRKHKKTNIMFIHGAWSSRHSFNYMSKMVDKYLSSYVKHVIFFEHNPIKEDLDHILRRAYKELDKEDIPTLVVGHSLGGLIALHITDHLNCFHTVTMSAPFSGVKIEKIFQPFVYSRAPILAEIAPDSEFIKNLHKKKYDKSVNCIITTQGYNPVMLEKTDGVVTIYSQERWVPEPAILTYISNNHHEILQSEQAFNIIKKIFINQ